MTLARPGWMQLSIALRDLKRAGVWVRGREALGRAEKRRFQIKPGRRRRRYWYIRRADFERIMEDAKAAEVAEALRRGRIVSFGEWVDAYLEQMPTRASK